MNIYAGEDAPMSESSLEFVTQEQIDKLVAIAENDKDLLHEYVVACNISNVEVLESGKYDKFGKWLVNKVAQDRLAVIKLINEYNKDNNIHIKALENSYKKHFGVLDLNQVPLRKLREYYDYKTQKEEVEDEKTNS